MTTFKPRHLVLAGAFALGALSLTGNASADTTYTVQSGDTLNAIATQHGTTTNEIGTKNSIKNINLIYVGDVIVIPGSIGNETQNDEVQVATEPVQAQAPSEPVQAQAPSEPVQNQSTSNSDALNALIARESSGNTNATNGQYYGIGQLSPQARAMYGGNSSDYNDQLNAMKAYISARYGTAENAWAHSQATGWY